MSIVPVKDPPKNCPRCDMNLYGLGFLGLSDRQRTREVFVCLNKKCDFGEMQIFTDGGNSKLIGGGMDCKVCGKAPYSGHITSGEHKGKAVCWNCFNRIKEQLAFDFKLQVEVENRG